MEVSELAAYKLELEVEVFGAVGAISTASQWFGVPGELLAVSTLVEEVKVSSVWVLHSAEGGGGD